MPFTPEERTTLLESFWNHQRNTMFSMCVCCMKCGHPQASWCPCSREIFDTTTTDAELEQFVAETKTTNSSN